MFYNKDISYRLDLIRALPLRMADRAQQVQLNFQPHKIFLETKEYNLSYVSKFPENLMLLHGAVIFLEFFAIKAFLMEWLD